MEASATDRKAIRSTIPARLDRLSWSPFHTPMVATDRIVQGRRFLVQPIDWHATWPAGATLTLMLALALLGTCHRARQPRASRGPHMLPLPTPQHVGTRDGAGAGDHDQPFSFGRRPRALWPYPFNTLQYARLLLLRSRWQDGLVNEHETASGAGGELSCTTRRDRSRTAA